MKISKSLKYFTLLKSMPKLTSSETNNDKMETLQILNSQNT